MEKELTKAIDTILERLSKEYEISDEGRYKMLVFCKYADWRGRAIIDESIDRAHRLSRLCEGLIREIQAIYELKKQMGAEDNELKVTIEHVESPYVAPAAKNPESL